TGGQSRRSTRDKRAGARSSDLKPDLAHLVRTGIGVDLVEGLAEVVVQGLGCGDGPGSGLDLNGAVAAGSPDEFADGPAGPGFDEAADGEGGQDDGQVSLDGVALAVVDRPGLEVVLGHAERFFDLPELVVG